MSVGRSVEVAELPHRNGFVRAVINGIVSPPDFLLPPSLLLSFFFFFFFFFLREQLDSGYVYKPLPDDPSKSFVQYVVNVDVKVVYSF